jgi:uncharacterized protein YjbJ (UPF0337 family)
MNDETDSCRDDRQRKEFRMGAKTDDWKGRAKEAAGALSGDKDLKREGKRDQKGAAIKGKIENAKESLDDAVDKAKDKLSPDK